VHTAETTRLRYFLDLLLLRKRPVMLVGAAGTGKTVLINDRVSSLGEDDYMVTNIPFNFYTTSEMLQHVMEQPLEKKAGRNYGPPGTKSLIYFVDDMNMPEVSSYYLATLCRLECPQHDGMPATRHTQGAAGSSRVLDTCSPCQRVGEIKAAAAGCGLPAGVWPFPPRYVSPGHSFKERVYDSDTSGHRVSRLYCYRAQK